MLTDLEKLGTRKSNYLVPRSEQRSWYKISKIFAEISPAKQKYFRESLWVPPKSPTTLHLIPTFDAASEYEVRFLLWATADHLVVSGQWKTVENGISGGIFGMQMIFHYIIRQKFLKKAE